MRHNNLFALTAFAILSAGIVAPALAQHAGHAPAAQSAAPKPGASPSDAAYKAAHDKMMKAMAIEATGNADVDFMRGMIPHHQGAIDMAEVALAHGKDPAVKKLARKIIADQKKEIAEMQAWLKKNGR